jgi:hypothetical protein
MLLVLPIARGGDEASVSKDQEVEIFEIQKRILESYQGAPRELQAGLFSAVQDRIIGWEQGALKFDRAQEDRISVLYERLRGQLYHRPEDADENHRKIRRFLEQKSAEEVVRELEVPAVLDRQHIESAIQDLEGMKYSSQKRVEGEPGTKLRGKLKEWVNGWKPADATAPDALGDQLALLDRAARITAGDEAALPDAVIDFAVRMAQAATASGPSAAILMKLNACLEKVRVSPLVASHGDLSRRLEEQMMKYFCFTPRMSGGSELRMEPASEKKGQPAEQAELIGVRYFELVDENSPFRELAGQISTRQVDPKQDFYLLPNKTLLLKYGLRTRNSPSESNASVQLLLDSFNTKAGERIDVPLPSSLIPDRSYLYVESVFDSACWLDSSCWTVRTVIERSGKWLFASKEAREAKARTLAVVLQHSNIPKDLIPGGKDMSDAADEKAFLGLFPNQEVLEDEFLLNDSAAGLKEVKQLFAPRGGLLLNGESLPGKDLATKLLEEQPWRGGLGFAPKKASAILIKDGGFSSKAPSDPTTPFCGICTIIALSKKGT